MTAYSQGDPRQKIQICAICNCPTGNCEEDSLYNSIEETGDTDGPLCQECFDSCNKKDMRFDYEIALDEIALQELRDRFPDSEDEK